MIVAVIGAVLTAVILFGGLGVMIVRESGWECLRYVVKWSVTVFALAFVFGACMTRISDGAWPWGLGS